MNVFEVRLISKFSYLNISDIKKTKLYIEVVREYDKALKEVLKSAKSGDYSTEYYSENIYGLEYIEYMLINDGFYCKINNRNNKLPHIYISWKKQ